MSYRYTFYPLLRTGSAHEDQGTKIFQYCTCPAGRVTCNFHLSCKHMHLSFKSVCNKEHKGVICNTTSSRSALGRITSPFYISLVITSGHVEFLSPIDPSLHD